ncbi:MAG: flavodoxin domain-containing protein [Lachnospiraceae bacterium]|nr:flavodoxin domain-containing protein [Lachnospiraceae bacterium]
MRTLIVYAGTAGATERCAHLLAEQMGDSKTADLNKETPDIDNYDIVVVGSNIHMGKFHKKVKDFMNTCQEELKNKKHGFFISNAFPEQAETFLMQNITQELLSTSICAASFGGELDVTKLKGMDKFIAKMVSNTTKGDESKVPKILEDSIKVFADTLKQA